MSTAQNLARAQARLDKAERRAGITSSRVGIPTDDPGALSGVRRTSTPRQRYREESAIDRSVDAAGEYVAAHKEVEHLQRKLAYEQRNQQIRENSTFEVPIEDLQPGDLVRYEHMGSPRNVVRVVRVNRKTVTCEAPGPGFDKPKIPLDRIIGTRKAGKE